MRGGDLENIIKMYAGVDKLPERNEYMLNVLRSWYSGNVADFHTYKIYNGENELTMHKKSLNMFKKVCEDWADSLANEKLEITLPERDGEILNKIFVLNDFKTLINDAVEKSFAYGYGALALRLDDIEIGERTGTIYTNNANIKIDFIDRTKIYPITTSGREIKEVAFVKESTRSTKIVMHLKQNDEYIIRNIKLDNKGNIIEQYDFNPKTKCPLFVIISPNININLRGETIAQSICQNSIDTLKTIDDIFDSMADEFVLARRRVFVSAKAYKVVYDSGKNKMVKTFDPYSTIFYQLENEDGKNDVKSIADPIRYDAYIGGLNTALNILSKQVGFGTQRYKFDQAQLQTATGVKSANQDFALSMVKHSRLLAERLTKLIFAIKELNNNWLTEKFSDFDITAIKIDFDDSVIEDNGTKQDRDKQDIQMNIMTIPEYRQKWYGETKEEAEKYYKDNFIYDKLNKYIPALQAKVITPEDFVKLVYGEENPEIVEYIKQSLENGSAEIVGDFE